MDRPRRRLVVLPLLCVLITGPALAQETVKPYFMTIVDNSGSMDGSTGGGTNSCAQPQTRMSDAKCVLQRIIDGYGDVVFGLERYQTDCTGTCASSCDTICGCSCTNLTCNGCNDNGSGCPAGGSSADQGQVLVDIREDNQYDIRSWIDFSCDGCSTTAADPELSAETWTPIAGSLRAARRYYEGGDPTFSTSPVPSDPYRGCRPYRVILLTDGEETCAGNSDTIAAATELRSTLVGADTYDILTYVIGFGVAPGTQDIEDIAIAGGTDAPGPDNVYYATDEDSLSLAFAQIIEDSILIEVCDNADNDCDGLTDEGFSKYCDIPGGVPSATLCADPGDPCDGLDDNCFDGIADEPVNGCGGCGPAPTEVCDGADNDCDGFVDEPPGDCGGCVPQPEVCDNLDNNCNGTTDESLVRNCGTDVGECAAGTQTCTVGVWSACSGAGPTPESCDDLDNNCDGVTDGIARPCGTAPDIGQCQPGTELCLDGLWGPCVGEIGPGPEVCDGFDNDCDGETDEGNLGGLPCEGDCGPGITECVAGQIVCAGVGTGMPEECNGLDDDCNGVTDDGLPTMGPCDEGGALCLPGLITCVDGEYMCVGGSPGEPETCDCLDNDCDGETDNGAGLCGPEGACLPAPHCRCAQPCAPGEFPCPAGLICETDFCVPDPCANVSCTPTTEVCLDGACVPICETVDDCFAPRVCRPSDGECVEDNCNGFPERCAEGQFCVDGECVDDPCTGVACAQNEFCRGGECVKSCAEVTCAEGQTCDAGDCKDDPCGKVECPDNQVCQPETRECIHDPCTARVCPSGETCHSTSGDCIPDPCLGVQCPDGEVCDGGNCWTPEQLSGEDKLPYTFVQIAGEGGCACSVGSSHRGGGLLLLLLLVLAGRRAGRAGRLALLGLVLGGCEPHLYCVDCEARSTEPDGSVQDAQTLDVIVIVPDGCALEICNGLDDDCNGLADDRLVEGVGEPCGTDIGACRPGATLCVDGEIRCGGDAQEPLAESCNAIDDDCDGVTDDGNPEGGISCGTNVGECVRGTQACVGGLVVCEGATGPAGELCDTLDNDCDGVVDDGDPEGGAPCLPMGACLPGALQCLGGTLQCVGAAGAMAELCDELDNDCDGTTDEDFDVLSDPGRCGDCDTVCTVENGQPACAGGVCDVAFCFSDYWDANGDLSDGCEYFCQFQGSEICNGADDDCDGTTDVGLLPPSLCVTVGECAGTTATCDGMGGWTCNYPPTVPTDPTGAILPESDCDGLDQDCDGVTDDAFPTRGQACSRGVGGCTTTGVIACNGTMDGVECTAADPPAGGAETCNGVDDDCDGTTDEGAPDAWVQITGPFGARWVYKFEASRPDATASSTGAMSHRSCSAPGRRPWTNVTYPEAQAACATVGGQLCTEEEWQRACQTTAATPCQWSYGSACGAYDPSACNGNDYDFDPMTTPEDEDGVLPTASLPLCFADWGTPADRIFDLSGNVKEWTEARSAGVNPLRGGAHNNTAGGIACPFDFVVGDDDFQFDNVGFRCCRDTAP